MPAAYKPSTSDARETPAQPIIEQLAALDASLTVIDPYVHEPVLQAGISFVEDVTVERVRDADLVLLVTDHDSFDHESIEREASLIFDARDRFGALGPATSSTSETRTLGVTGSCGYRTLASQ